VGQQSPNAPSTILVSNWYRKGVGHGLSCFYDTKTAVDGCIRGMGGPPCTL